MYYYYYYATVCVIQVFVCTSGGLSDKWGTVTLGFVLCDLVSMQLREHYWFLPSLILLHLTVYHVGQQLIFKIYSKGIWSFVLFNWWETSQRSVEGSCLLQFWQCCTLGVTYTCRAEWKSSASFFLKIYLSFRASQVYNI